MRKISNGRKDYYRTHGDIGEICPKCNCILLGVYVHKIVNKIEISGRLYGYFYCEKCDEFKETIFSVKHKGTKVLRIFNEKFITP